MWRDGKRTSDMNKDMRHKDVGNMREIRKEVRKEIRKMKIGCLARGRQ